MALLEKLGHDVRAAARAEVCLVIGTSALVYPAALRPLNKAWFLFGMLLSKVMTPIVMGLLFVLTVRDEALIPGSIEEDRLDRLLAMGATATIVVTARTPATADRLRQLHCQQRDLKHRCHRRRERLSPSSGRPDRLAGELRPGRNAAARRRRHGS